MFDKVGLECEFFAALLRADAEIAGVVGAGGCGRCGGRLHRGNFLRKPRGALFAGAGEEDVVRYSFCCGREGCRRRTTPPSLRFLGRRVYLEAVVLVASVVAAIRGVGRTAEREVGVPPRTLGRWLAWWQGSFLLTSEFVTLAAALALGTSAARAAMPASLWQVSPSPTAAGKVAWLAERLASLTTTSTIWLPSFEGSSVMRRLAQKMA